MMDPGPVELEAMMATLSISNNNWVVLDTRPWRYYAEKYNAKREVWPVCEFHQEIELVQCLVGQDLVKYLANREKDRERSQSNPHCMWNNLLWCRRRKSLNQESIYNVLRTGLWKEGGGDGFPSRPVRP
jgi:hypothetical protein